MTDLPPLGVVATRVAHDVRGPVGVIIAALHEIEETLNGLSDTTVGADLKRLLEMARRGTRKLERTAFTLDTIGALTAPAVSAVDLQPMVKTAAERMQAAERRPQVAVTWVSPEATLRVQVAPPLFTHALEELFGYALRKSAKEIRVTMMSSNDTIPYERKGSESSIFSLATHEHGKTVNIPRATSLVVLMVGVEVIPASTIPFEEPLGLAAHLFEVQRVGMTIEKQADGVAFVVDVPSP